MSDLERSELTLFLTYDIDMRNCSRLSPVYVTTKHETYICNSLQDIVHTRLVAWQW